jgi:cell division protein FtsW (lipid II flippase)
MTIKARSPERVLDIGQQNAFFNASGLVVSAALSIMWQPDGGMATLSPLFATADRK